MKNFEKLENQTELLNLHDFIKNKLKYYEQLIDVEVMNKQ